MSWDNKTLMETLGPLKNRKNQGEPLFGLKCRSLTKDEIVLLEGQGNFSLHWEDLSVSLDFNPRSVRFSQFSGRVFLGCTAGGGVYYSTVEDCELYEGVLIHRVNLLRRTVVLPGARLRGCEVDCSTPGTFGLDGHFKAGLETPGKEFPLSSEASLEEFTQALYSPELQNTVQALNKAVEWDRSVICSGTQVVGGYLDRVFVGPGAQIKNILCLENSCVLSSQEEPVILGDGALIKDSVLQWGVQVDSGAQVVSSQLLEYSGAQRQALVTHSLLGPNTLVGEGEVTASLVGPFVGIHHHSLLIAAYWPQGGGNLGYGANVGSNHTGRLPDQEIRPGEGQFFGLGVNVKFPCDFTQAPYTLVATGVTLPPQRFELPYSLILPGQNPVDNRIIPGWALSENLYTLFRNRKKYASRDKSRRQAYSLDPFRGELVDKMWKAWENLGSIGGKDIYDHKDWSGLGAGSLTETDRIAGMKSYENVIRFLCLQEILKSRRENRPADTLLIRGNSQFGWEKLDINDLKPLFLAELEKIIAAVKDSRSRDDFRGQKIIDDYAQFHEPWEKDGVIKDLGDLQSDWVSWKGS